MTSLRWRKESLEREGDTVFVGWGGCNERGEREDAREAFWWLIDANYFAIF